LQCGTASPRNVARTCRHFGISRRAFYKWKRRFEKLGVALRKATAWHRLQLDVKFLERIPGTRKRFFQFTAIDDCTRIRVLKVYDACTQATAIRFVNDVVRRLPFRVHVIQTACYQKLCQGFGTVGRPIEMKMRAAAVAGSSCLIRTRSRGSGTGQAVM